MVHMSLQSLATTTPVGADWMICNQFDIILVQLSMAVKFMSLVEEVE